MNRTDWLKKMRTMAESLYDHIAPAYGEKYGLQIYPTHRTFIQKFLSRLNPHSAVLDAACGAGLYDGILLDAGHTILGIDQSGTMLARARELYPQARFPGLRYEKMGLQEMDFKAAFDGLICMDALEHICPEDIPGILANFHSALKPGSVLYITVDALELGDYRESFDLARAMGLPVVFGEVVDELDEVYALVMDRNPLDLWEISGTRLDHSVYHYHPSMPQLRQWLGQSGSTLVEEAIGDEYWHVLAMKIRK